MDHKMSKQEARKLLISYQQWRKGRVDYFPVSPAKLSQAIDLAISNLEEEVTKKMYRANCLEREVKEVLVEKVEGNNVHVITDGGREIEPVTGRTVMYFETLEEGWQWIAQQLYNCLHP